MTRIQSETEFSTEPFSYVISNGEPRIAPLLTFGFDDDVLLAQEIELDDMIDSAYEDTPAHMAFASSEN